VKNNGPLGAGGRALATPFGTFYGPNITPHPELGIGRWSEADFIRALREGTRPDGTHYFPVFPYTSYTRIADQDLRDLRAYIFSLPPVARPNRPHDVRFPFNLRFLLGFWRWLYFWPGAFRPDPARSAEINRGVYLVEALGHCEQCHTPRTALGGLDRDFYLAGTRRGPDGARVPNITPDPATGIGRWSPEDLMDLLSQGMTPDGDFVGATMAEVVRSSTSRLSEADRAAITAYLRSLPPIRRPLRARGP
jgi:mono/diheme cytochrome c family protein